MSHTQIVICHKVGYVCDACVTYTVTALISIYIYIYILEKNLKK